MPSTKLTIYDIAREAGVSIATVSHVLNDTGRVGSTTRQKILQTIRSIGYEPSMIASALAGKNTRSLAFIVPDVNNPYFSEVVRGAEDEAFDKGYSLLICNTDNNPNKEEVYIRMLRQKRIDGLVIATGSTPQSMIDELISSNIRVVSFSREIEDVRVGSVMVDNFTGGYLAARHLLDLGHRLIGFINEPATIKSSRDRLDGFEHAIKQTEAEYHIFNTGQFGLAAGVQMAVEVLTQYPVTALFAANDQLAVGALQACRQLGKGVPQDVSIIGFDGTVLCEIVQPTLTTIAQPIYDLGRQTIHLLINGVEEEQQPREKVVMKPELVIRESTTSIR